MQSVVSQAASRTVPNSVHYRQPKKVRHWASGWVDRTGMQGSHRQTRITGVGADPGETGWVQQDRRIPSASNVQTWCLENARQLARTHRVGNHLAGSFEEEELASASSSSA